MSVYGSDGGGRDDEVRPQVLLDDLTSVIDFTLVVGFVAAVYFLRRRDITVATLTHALSVAFLVLTVGHYIERHMIGGFDGVEDLVRGSTLDRRRFADWSRAAIISATAIATVVARFWNCSGVGVDCVVGQHASVHYPCKLKRLKFYYPVFASTVVFVYFCIGARLNALLGGSVLHPRGGGYAGAVLACPPLVSAICVTGCISIWLYSVLVEAQRIDLMLVRGRLHSSYNPVVQNADRWGDWGGGFIKERRSIQNMHAVENDARVVTDGYSLGFQRRYDENAVVAEDVMYHEPFQRSGNGGGEWGGEKLSETTLTSSFRQGNHDGGRARGGLGSSSTGVSLSGMRGGNDPGDVPFLPYPGDVRCGMAALAPDQANTTGKSQEMSGPSYENDEITNWRTAPRPVTEWDNTDMAHQQQRVCRSPLDNGTTFAAMPWSGNAPQGASQPAADPNLGLLQPELSSIRPSLTHSSSPRYNHPVLSIGHRLRTAAISASVDGDHNSARGSSFPATTTRRATRSVCSDASHQTRTRRTTLGTMRPTQPHIFHGGGTRSNGVGGGVVSVDGWTSSSSSSTGTSTSSSCSGSCARRRTNRNISSVGGKSCRLSDTRSESSGDSRGDKHAARSITSSHAGVVSGEPYTLELPSSPRVQLLNLEGGAGGAMNSAASIAGSNRITAGRHREQRRDWGGVRRRQAWPS